jgi:hypothetical protein
MHLPPSPPGRATRHLIRSPLIVSCALVVAGAAAVAAAPLLVDGSGDDASAAASARGAAEQYPYDPKALFNRPIAPGTGTDPRSGGIIRQLAENARRQKVTLSSDGEVPPVYVGKPGHPLYRVSVGGSTFSFRAPPSVQAGSGADHPLVVLNPKHPSLGPDVELRLWQASVSRSSRRISASGAGLFRYNNDGRRIAGRIANGLPFRGQGTGSQTSILVGLIRPAEVRRGRIPHAIRFAYSRSHMGSGYRLPAVKSDQRGGGSGAMDMDMGMRLQLDRSVNCAKRTVPGRSSSSGATGFLRTLCRSLQDYGMIVLDGTSDRNVLLEMEDGSTAGWSRILGPTNNGSYSFIVRDRTTPEDGLSRNSTSGIPWSRMRVVERGG